MIVNQLISWYRSEYNISVKQKWIEENITRQHQQTGINHKVKEDLYAKILISDFKYIISNGCLPEDVNNNSSTTLVMLPMGKYCLQIESLIDVSTPAYSQYRKLAGHDDSNLLLTEEYQQHITQKVQKQKVQNKSSSGMCGSSCSITPGGDSSSSNRMLWMSVSDGRCTMAAMEYRTIPTLSVDTAPGVKIMLHGKVKCRRGVLMLSAENTMVLGGHITERANVNTQINLLAQKLNIAGGDEDNTVINGDNHVTGSAGSAGSGDGFSDDLELDDDDLRLLDTLETQQQQGDNVSGSEGVDTEVQAQRAVVTAGVDEGVMQRRSRMDTIEGPIAPSAAVHHPSAATPNVEEAINQCTAAREGAATHCSSSSSSISLSLSLVTPAASPSLTASTPVLAATPSLSLHEIKRPSVATPLSALKRKYDVEDGVNNMGGSCSNNKATAFVPPFKQSNVVSEESAVSRMSVSGKLGAARKSHEQQHDTSLQLPTSTNIVYTISEVNHLRLVTSTIFVKGFVLSLVGRLRAVSVPGVPGVAGAGSERRWALRAVLTDDGTSRLPVTISHPLLTSLTGGLRPHDVKTLKRLAAGSGSGSGSDHHRAAADTERVTQSVSKCRQALIDMCGIFKLIPGSQQQGEEGEEEACGGAAHGLTLVEYVAASEQSNAIYDLHQLTLNHRAIRNQQNITSRAAAAHTINNMQTFNAD